MWLLTLRSPPLSPIFSIYCSRHRRAIWCASLSRIKSTSNGSAKAKVMAATTTTNKEKSHKTVTNIENNSSNSSRKMIMMSSMVCKLVELHNRRRQINHYQLLQSMYSKHTHTHTISNIWLSFKRSLFPLILFFSLCTFPFLITIIIIMLIAYVVINSLSIKRKEEEWEGLLVVFAIGHRIIT